VQTILILFLTMSSLAKLVVVAELGYTTLCSLSQRTKFFQIAIKNQTQKVQKINSEITD